MKKTTVYDVLLSVNALLVALVLLLLLARAVTRDNGQAQPTPTLTVQANEPTASPTLAPTLTPTPSLTPSPSPTATLTVAVPTTSPTVRASPTAPLFPTASWPTPTQEAYSRDRGCALLNQAWDDPLAGCNITRNPFFLSGAVRVGVIDVPRQWGLLADSTLPVACFNTQCDVDLAATGGNMAFVGYQQTLQGVERGQCYVAKLSVSFHVLGRSTAFPPDLYVLFNGNEQAYTRDNDPAVAGQANFIRSLREFVWPVRGTANSTPTVTFALRRNFPSYANGSRASLLGLFVFAAPENFCANGALLLN